MSWTNLWDIDSGTQGHPPSIPFCSRHRCPFKHQCVCWRGGYIVQIVIYTWRSALLIHPLIRNCVKTTLSWIVLAMWPLISDRTWKRHGSWTCSPASISSTKGELIRTEGFASTQPDMVYSCISWLQKHFSTKRYCSKTQKRCKGNLSSRYWRASSPLEWSQPQALGMLKGCLL